MTTTDSPPRGGTPPGAARSAVRALLATGVLGALLAVVAGVVTGGPGVAGVAVGVGLTFLSLGLGSLVLAFVTELSPGMSLVVAMMTYTLQVVLLLVAYVLLQGSAEARAAVSGPWLGATVIATTLLWLALQVRGLVTARQPYFDLAGEDAPDEGPERPAGAREAGTT